MIAGNIHGSANLRLPVGACPFDLPKCTLRGYSPPLGKLALRWEEFR